MVAITGDSITEQKLYSVFIEDYLLMCQPVPNVRAHVFGWSGDTANGLLAKQKNLILPFKPTVATTCYGMNDGGYLPLDPNRIAKYKQALSDAVKAFKDAGVHFIVVGGPGAVDTDRFKTCSLAKTTPEKYNETLENLSNAAREVAQAEGAVFADVHGAMMDAMAKAKAKYGNSYFLARDGVHPALNGHLVMAYIFLKAMGLKGDIGTITMDMRDGTATASAGQKVISVTEGSIELESTRYPFCFQGEPANPDSTLGMLEFVPFNDELNRYVLIVKNARSAKLKVTWGSSSKEFSAAELEKGINLAAEFPKNPFCGSFTEVENAIRKQQEYDTVTYKILLPGLPVWKDALSTDPETFEKMSKSVFEKSGSMSETAVAAVKPVTHTIKVEPVQ